MPIVHITLMIAEPRNSHHVTALKPTNTGMANGAVGGRYASTFSSALGCLNWPRERHDVAEDHREAQREYQALHLILSLDHRARGGVDQL